MVLCLLLIIHAFQSSDISLITLVRVEQGPDTIFSLVDCEVSCSSGAGFSTAFRMKFLKAVLILLMFLMFETLAGKVRFDFYKVHRFAPKCEHHLKALRELMKNSKFNFWTEPSIINRTVDVMVPPYMRPHFYEFLNVIGMQSSVLIENVQKLIDEQEVLISNRSTTMDWTNYHTLEEFETWMDDLAKRHNHVRVIVAGKTYEKRDIKGLQITFKAGFRTVFIESMIHAREWISGAATSWVINEILNSSVDSIWRKFNYIYVPFCNPDGYVYSWTTNRLWRKTRAPYNWTFTTCFGADPNRNWDFHWGETGSSNFPCSETYRGPQPFSEVETKTLSEFLRANAKALKIDAYLAFHSYSQLIMYPWGYTSKPAPLNKIWQKIGEAAAEDLYDVNKENFNVGDIYKTVYPVSGTSLEWFYGTFNSTISFVYELRDTGRYGFMLPPKYILPSAKELFASVQRILIEYSKLPPKY